MSDDRSAAPRLRDRVLADARLQAELAPIEDAAALSERLLALAAEEGIALDPADLAPFLRPDPLGISALSDPVPLRRLWPGADWLPVAVHRLPGGEEVVDWAHLAGAPLTASFFATAVRPIAVRPFNRLFRYRMRLEDFVAAAADEPLPEPDGFIFHMSRCGSTLVAQMLAALPGSEIVSEASPLDAVARHAAFGDGTDAAAMLRAMAGALGRRGGRPFVVKLDFWQALALALYRRAFPTVPWLFLFRDPVEVLVSQMNRRGAETMPGIMPELGVDPAAPEPVQIAQALARICEAAADAAAAGGGLFVDYADLPEAVFSAILPHFRVDPGETRPLMAAAAARDAKTPSQPFESDAQTKRAQADEEIRAASRLLESVHERLTAFHR
ncbi:MAG TPA: hypothetical protein VH331_16170 [Allosphingosinicella sp.]|jgi:hypothetical protein|nr:hypothetical protein [Allosphingosinicella sp.]